MPSPAKAGGVASHGLSLCRSRIAGDPVTGVRRYQDIGFWLSIDAKGRTSKWFWAHALLSGLFATLAAYSKKERTPKSRDLANCFSFIVAVSRKRKTCVLEKTSLVGLNRVYVAVTTTPQAEQIKTAEYKASRSAVA